MSYGQHNATGPTVGIVGTTWQATGFADRSRGLGAFLGEQRSAFGAHVAFYRRSTDLEFHHKLRRTRGTFAPPEALAANLRESIAEHEMRLLAYRQNSQYIPVRGKLPKENVRNNPYAAGGEEDPFFSLIVRFAIDFEKTYLRWLHETLAFVEENQQRDENEPGG